MKVTIEFKEYLKSKTENCARHVAAYSDKDSEEFTCRTAWFKGYWEGKLAALEDIYALISREVEK